MSSGCLLAPLLSAPTVIDVPTSRKLSARVEAVNRECYMNALRALLYLNDAAYVEGTVVVHRGIILPHAWLETPRGVVDPTPGYAVREPGDCTYFPGPRWSAEINMLVDTHEDGLFPPLLRHFTKEGPNALPGSTRRRQHFATHQRSSWQPQVSPP